MHSHNYANLLFFSKTDKYSTKSLFEVLSKTNETKRPYGMDDDKKILEKQKSGVKVGLSTT